MKTDIGNVKTIRTIDPTVAKVSINPPLCPSAESEKQRMKWKLENRFVWFLHQLVSNEYVKITCVCGNVMEEDSINPCITISHYTMSHL